MSIKLKSWPWWQLYTRADLYSREIGEKCATGASATLIKESLWQPIKLAIQSSPIIVRAAYALGLEKWLC